MYFLPPPPPPPIKLLSQPLIEVLARNVTNHATVARDFLTFSILYTQYCSLRYMTKNINYDVSCPPTPPPPPTHTPTQTHTIAHVMILLMIEALRQSTCPIIAVSLIPPILHTCVHFFFDKKRISQTAADSQVFQSLDCYDPGMAILRQYCTHRSYCSFWNPCHLEMCTLYIEIQIG